MEVASNNQGLGVDADLLADMRASGLLTDEDVATLGAQEISIDEEDAAAVAETLESEEQRQALYAEQESVTNLVEPENDVTNLDVPEAARKPRRTRSASTGTAKPRAPRALPETIELREGAGDVDFSELLSGINAKKVREKALNLAQYFHSGSGSLSVFTRIGLEVLRSEGQISAKRLVQAYQDGGKKSGGTGFSLGTARSQSQQVVTLFRAFGVIAADGTPNADSTIWKAAH